MRENSSLPRSRTRRQIKLCEHLFDDIWSKGIDVSALPHVEQLIDRAVMRSSGADWSRYGEYLKKLVRSNDVDSLHRLLTAPGEHGDRYRSLSPLIMLLISPERSREIVGRPPFVTSDQLQVS